MGTEAKRPTMDVGESMQQASAAARRGDVTALEQELARLGELRSDQLETVAASLRRLAACVRAHPSFGRRATEGV